jgi:hypothetical protein
MPRGLLFVLFLHSAAFADAEVTFNRDILPILQDKCQGCHRQGEAAPMPLMSYAEARPYAAAIRQAVATGKMPPWHADPAHGKFLNERRLTSAEIETLTAWVRTGAREGDPKDAPVPRKFNDGWTIGQPDAVFDMGADYKVPAQGTIDYTYFVVPTNFTADKWVEKIELRPGARSVVHHIVLFARPKGSEFHKDARPGVPFVPHLSNRPKERKPDTGKGVLEGLVWDERARAELISVYVPGGDAYVTRPGQARLIPAGSDLIFQMHYTASGREAVDRSKVGIVFAKEAPRERVVNAFVSNRQLVIPPGADNHKVEARVTVHEDVKLQSFFPHMHLRGKAMEYRAVLPEGKTQILLRVPKYDFNWQMSYLLAEPITLPKGSHIEVTAWYDNSPNNPFNPDPKKEVYWGDQSWEEMLAGFVDFVIPAGVDPMKISGVAPVRRTAANTAQASR